MSASTLGINPAKANCDSIDFATWMKSVDRVVLVRLGVSVHDLPDLAFRDSYDAGCTPMEFVDDEIGDDADEAMDRLFG